MPEVIERHFSLGSHLNARDRKAVRKTVSGLMKILYPHGEATQSEIVEQLAPADALLAGPGSPNTRCLDHVPGCPLDDSSAGRQVSHGR